MNSEQHALPATTQAQQEVRIFLNVRRLLTKLQMRDGNVLFMFKDISY